MKSDIAPTVDERPSGDKPRTPDEPLAPRNPHNRYEVHDEIARGGMGRVVEATDTLLGRRVAVKEALASTDEALRRFRREIYITARLEHPSIVPVHDAGTLADGSPFYVMRKVTGRPLDQLIANAATLQERLALLPHVVAAAQAIAHAHKRGVVHRDIKPTNILVGELGETVVIDWGLAKVVDEIDEPATAQPVDAGSSLRTRFGVVFGTPGFMAPEQARGEPVDARSDVYALGATLYYTFTRQPPHANASETEMMSASASGPPRPIGEIVDGLPGELSTIVDKCLAYDERARYADASALAEDLQRFISGQLVASHRYSTRERLVRFIKRNRVAVVIASIAIVTVLVGGTLAVRGIVSARDRADAQAALATVREREAEAARLSEQRRNDQVLVTQAQVLAESNPTAAVALVKELRQPPERWERMWRPVRAIASSARQNGVAYVLPASATAALLVISPKTTRAASLTREGAVTAYDLVARTSAVLKVPQFYSLQFADEDHLVAFSESHLWTIDLAHGRAATSVDTHAYLRLITPISTVVWAVDTDGNVLALDRASGVSTRLAIPEKVHLMVASPDRKWIALAGDTRVFLVDLVHGSSVRQLETGLTQYFSWNREGTQLLVTFLHEVHAISIPDGKVTVRTFGKNIVLQAMKSAQETFYSTTSGLYVTQGADLLPLAMQQRNDANTQILMVGGTGLISRSDHIDVFDHSRQYTLTSPAGPITTVAASPLGYRVVALTPGHLLLWDTGDHRPAFAQFEDISTFVMVGAKNALILKLAEGWSWLDFDKREGHHLPNIAMVYGSFSVGFSANVAGAAPNEERVWTVRDGVPEKVDVPGLVMIAGLSESSFAYVTRHEIILDDATSHRSVIFKHDGSPSNIEAVPAFMVCTYRDGLVVRYEVATRRIETLQLDGVRDEHITSALSPTGDVFIARGRSIIRWQRDGLVLAHATLPLPIIAQSSLAQHIFAETSDGGAYSVSFDSPAKILTLPSNLTGWFAYTAELGVFLGGGETIRVLDVATGESWPISTPRQKLASRLLAPAISDDGRRVGVMIDEDFYEWDSEVPLDRDVTARWLDQLTNATAELGTATLTFH